MSNKRTAFVFHYNGLAAVALVEVPVCEFWVVRSTEQLYAIGRQYGSFRHFGKCSLAENTTMPGQRLSGAAVTVLLLGLATFWAAREEAPTLAPQPHFRKPIVWTENTDQALNRRFAIICSHQPELDVLAVVFGFDQLGKLAMSVNRQHWLEILLAIQATAQLPRNHTQPDIVIDGPLAKDLIYGLTMSRQLILSPGV